MKRYILIFYWTLCVTIAFPQIVPEDNRFITPSPTVAELGKYGVIPVSHYTGVPNISVSIYNLQCGQLTLPISLNYHAGGIKVDQIASWVGLGWSLNAGGVIAVNIMGRSDLYARIPIKDSVDISNGVFPSLKNLLAATENSDSQPDIYSYNFAGHAGQFVMEQNDQNMEPYNIRNNKEIKINYNAINRTFSISDNNGNTYMFMDKEETRYESLIYYYSVSNNQLSEPEDPVSSMYIPTAFFLSEIVSADKADTIRFVYEDETYYQEGKLTGKILYNFEQRQWESSSDREYTNIPRLSVIKTQNKTKRLTEIKANNGTNILFQTPADYNREDLLGVSYSSCENKYLDRIAIFHNNNEIKNWQFTYNYFLSSVNHTASTVLSNNQILEPLNKRLKLISITEQDKKPYKFEYYGDLDSEPRMPYRTAFCGSDYWGFCNGVVSTNNAIDTRKLFSNISNRNVIFKKELLSISQNGNPSRIYTESARTISYSYGSDRAPDSSYMHAYTLKKIVYPTKGFTEFFYSPHQYGYVGNESVDNTYCGGLRIHTIKHYTGNDVRTINYDYRMLSPDLRETQNKSSGSVINEFSDLVERWIHSQEGSPQVSAGYMERANNWNTYELSSSSYTSLYSYGGDYIGYSYVRESDGNGSRIYNYLSIKDFPNQYNSIYSYLFYNYKESPQTGSYTEHLSQPQYPFLHGYWGKSFGRGLLQKTAVFDNENRLMQIQENEYEFSVVKKIYGMEIIPERPYRDYLLNVYYHQAGQALLKKHTRTDYDQNGLNPVHLITGYEYNAYNQVSQETTTQSDGRMLATRYTYPPDLAGTSPNLFRPMTEAYIISPVIEKKTSIIDGNSIRVVDAEQQQYQKIFSSFFKPSIISKLETTAPVATGQDYSSKMKEVISFDYDRNGRLIHSHPADGPPTVYLWGYNHQYPIARIENASYAEVKTALGAITPESIAARQEPSDADFAAINDLRNNTSLKKALITTCTYRPLVGMTSETDPAGRTVFYEYDAFGRLCRVKDENGNILKDYQYNYAH